MLEFEETYVSQAAFDLNPDACKDKIILSNDAYAVREGIEKLIKIMVNQNGR